MGRELIPRDTQIQPLPPPEPETIYINIPPVIEELESEINPSTYVPEYGYIPFWRDVVLFLFLLGIAAIIIIVGYYMGVISFF